MKSRVSSKSSRFSSPSIGWGSNQPKGTLDAAGGGLGDTSWFEIPSSLDSLYSLDGTHGWTRKWTWWIFDWKKKGGQMGDETIKPWYHCISEGEWHTHTHTCLRVPSVENLMAKLCNYVYQVLHFFLMSWCSSSRISKGSLMDSWKMSHWHEPLIPKQLWYPVSMEAARVSCEYMVHMKGLNSRICRKTVEPAWNQEQDGFQIGYIPISSHFNMSWHGINMDSFGSAHFLSKNNSLNEKAQQWHVLYRQNPLKNTFKLTWNSQQIFNVKVLWKFHFLRCLWIYWHT